MPKKVKYIPRIESVPEERKQEFNGHQRFSDIHRCEHKDGFILIRAHRDRDQFGDKHGGHVRDKIMKPKDALEWASTARDIATRLAINGDMVASAELTEIAEDMEHKIKEALVYREKHNMSPDEVEELLKWHPTHY